MFSEALLNNLLQFVRSINFLRKQYSFYQYKLSLTKRQLVSKLL